MTEPMPATLLAGRYRLEKLLGEGGMASVYEAFDVKLNTTRAIKILHHNYSKSVQVRRRFEDEAQAQAQLRHPHILLVHDVIDDGTTVFMVMELADRGSLFQRVRAEGPLPPREVAEVGIKMLDALQAAHDADMVHRDIKPENILVDAKGSIKVADFGIARVVDRRQDLTKTGVTMGTWAYMPPEQRTDAKSVDARADVYAAGATLYFLTTGRQPFDIHNAESHAVAFENFPELLAAVIQKATRFNPDDRYANSRDMAAALEGVKGQLSNLAVFGPPVMASRTVDPNPPDEPRANRTVAASVHATLMPDPPTGEVDKPRPQPTLHEPRVVQLAVGQPTRSEAPSRSMADEPAPRSGMPDWLIAGMVAMVVVAVGFALYVMVEPQDAGVAVGTTTPGETVPPISTPAVVRTEPDGRPIEQPPTPPATIPTKPRVEPSAEGAVTGSINARSNPYGAKVFVEGVSQPGMVLEPMRLLVGTYTVRLQLGTKTSPPLKVVVDATHEQSPCWDFDAMKDCTAP